MVNNIKKKINKLTEKIVNFIRRNMARIVVVGGVFIFLQLIKSFPYINIIPSYQYLTIGFTIFLAIVFFGVKISSKVIAILIIILFVIAGITTILELENISDLIGFIVFVLLIFILRQVIIDRKELKKETSE